jgi:predicted nucleic acid-binding Zn ribbon protein
MRKRRSRSEILFYILSILIVVSMVLSMIYVAVLPNG